MAHRNPNYPNLNGYGSIHDQVEVQVEQSPDPQSGAHEVDHEALRPRAPAINPDQLRSSQRRAKKIILLIIATSFINILAIVVGAGLVDSTDAASCDSAHNPATAIVPALYLSFSGAFFLILTFCFCFCQYKDSYRGSTKQFWFMACIVIANLVFGTVGCLAFPNLNDKCRVTTKGTAFVIYAALKFTFGLLEGYFLLKMKKAGELPFDDEQVGDQEL